ncbi:N-acetylmuramoyl-L-alanine amidase family protein [Terrimonas alba]|uniref:N-acetylmuramoyl-L-alanine amidase family protein n=1 Tax=Terrimonas alba TaxID=3349636 RepID=UPI0035F3476C
MKRMVKRGVLFLFPIGLSILLFSFSGKNQQPSPKAALIKTLIIDPGHGGIDPGARGSFSNEADVSLAVSLKFGKALQEEFPDLKIVYTRTTDVMAGNKRTKDEGLRYRANLANESGGDLFIAIHCNSAPHIRHREFAGYKSVTSYVGRGKKRRRVTKKVPQYRYWTSPNPAHGTETYIWAVNKNDAKVSAVNKIGEEYGEQDSTLTIALPDPSDPAEKARMLIYAQNYFRKSLNLADLVEKEFIASGRFSRGVKQRNHAGIWVLQATGMPSILVELGFISHPEDERYINSEKGQEEMVEDLVNAFKAYKQKIESRSISTSNE